MLLLATLVALALLLGSLQRIPEGTVATVHRFGRYVRTLSPGLHLTLPLADRIAHRLRMVGHQVEVPLQAPSPARADVFYQILEPERAGGMLEHIDALVHEQALDLWQAGFAQDESPADPAELAARLRTGLNHELAGLGLRVTRCRLHFEPH